MRIFKTKWMVRYARRERIADRSLRETIERAARGTIDADLGGGIIKQRVARAGAADVVSLKLVKHGGLLATREVAGVAEAAGIGLYGGCLLESSIGAAAHLQVFAGLRELGWGCEHFGPQILVDDLVEEPLRFADFRVHLPAGPGLGVALDRNKLRHYARG